MTINLQLSKDCYFSAIQSDIKEFSEDEIEIWLISNQNRLCVFKDSLKYVLSEESRRTVEFLQYSTINDGNILSDNFLNYCSDSDCNDDSFILYQLFEYNCHVVWIMQADNKNNIRIELWNINPYAEPIIKKKEFEFELCLEDFFTWWNKILTLY